MGQVRMVGGQAGADVAWNGDVMYWAQDGWICAQNQNKGGVDYLEVRQVEQRIKTMGDSLRANRKTNVANSSSAAEGGVYDNANLNRLATWLDDMRRLCAKARSQGKPVKKVQFGGFNVPILGGKP